MENQKLIICFLTFFIFTSAACQTESDRILNNDLKSTLVMDSVLAPVLISNLNISEHNKSALPLWSKYQKKNSKTVSALRIYQDGEIYFWQKISIEDQTRYAWQFISKVNEAGIEKVAQLISDQFFLLEANNEIKAKGKVKTILWMASLDGKTHATKTYALPYSKLPKVLDEIQKAYNSHIIPKKRD